MKPTVLFGTGKIADVIHFQMTHDGGVDVAACTVDGEFVTADEFRGVPVVPFEDVVERYPPDDFRMFVALGYQDMNDLRTNALARVRELGYEIATFVHPESGMPACTELGENCFVAALAFVKAGTEVPANSLVAGIPAEVMRSLSDEEIAWKTSWCSFCSSAASRPWPSPPHRSPPRGAARPGWRPRECWV